MKHEQSNRKHNKKYTAYPDPLAKWDKNVDPAAFSAQHWEDELIEQGVMENHQEAYRPQYYDEMFMHPMHNTQFKETLRESHRNFKKERKLDQDVEKE